MTSGRSAVTLWVPGRYVGKTVDELTRGRVFPNIRYGVTMVRAVTTSPS